MNLNIKSAYDTWAESYDAVENKTRDLDEQIIKELLPSFTDKIIVEAGCGTAKNTILICGSAKKIYAMDFSEKMIEKAREKVNRDNVEFIIQDLSGRWQLNDSIADIVLIDLVLEHIKDFGFVFREAYRALNIGGKLFVNEYHPEKQLLGKKANFIHPDLKHPVEIDSFVHTVEEYSDASLNAGFIEVIMTNVYDKNDGSPRLLSLTAVKN